MKYPIPPANRRLRTKTTKTAGRTPRLNRMRRFLLFLLLLTTSAQADDRERLLALHETDRRAHLIGDADLLTSCMADELREASRGAVSRVSREAVRRRFASYFTAVKYKEWKDTVPPQVFVSPDGTMAWMIVAVQATVETSSPDGTRKTQRFVSSWIATYAKHEGQWKMTAISSSVRDADPKA